MSQTRIRLTRSDLYAKVWATPMRILAKEFGMSDVGLAKVCRKHNVPVPPVGYWRRKEEEFSWLDNLAEVSINGQPIVLCHYALRVWNRSNRGSWHLYGHSHGRLLEVPRSLSMDVGVDTRDLRPWHFDEIADIMRKKAEAPALAPDH